MSAAQVVVLAPVRNEAWILDRFLAVCSEFADLIIVSDQGSTDGSREIYQQYPKVRVIENTDTRYDEASRQRRLIEAARGWVPGPRILLALDSDEILAADAPKSEDWQRMLGARPGTVLHFEKPDLFGLPQQAIRYKNLWPLGYVDDGCEHHPKTIHSIRIPQPSYADHLYLPDIQVLHYALTRATAQRSKMRYYSVVENLNGTMRFYTRRKGYGSRRDFKLDGTLEPSPPRWFEGWQAAGIDMFTIPTQKYYWQDIEILKLFKEHGCTRFWLDDIWDIDWSDVRRYAVENGHKDIQYLRIDSPPFPLESLLKGMDKLRELYDARAVAT